MAVLGPHPRATGRGTAAAHLAVATSVAFVVLLAALHVIRPDLDPSWRFISEYELGPHGWLMQLAFVTLAVSCVAVTVAVLPFLRIGGYLGVAMLLMSAAGMVLAAIHVPDKANRLHEVGAMLDQVPFGAVLIGWSLSRHAAWREWRWPLRVLSLVPLVGLAVFVGSMAVQLPRHGGRPGPDVLVGWPNRIMILAHCAWIIPVAWLAARLRTGRAA
jgi:hypothetical protein